MTTTKRPTEEQIRLRAYHLYLERDQAEGSAISDWLRAEEQLIAEMGVTPEDHLLKAAMTKSLAMATGVQSQNVEQARKRRPR